MKKREVTDGRGKKRAQWGKTNDKRGLTNKRNRRLARKDLLTGPWGGNVSLSGGKKVWGTRVKKKKKLGV